MVKYERLVNSSFLKGNALFQGRKLEFFTRCTKLLVSREMIYEFGFSPVVAVVYLSGEERALGAREYAHCEDE